MSVKNTEHYDSPDTPLSFKQILYNLKLIFSLLALVWTVLIIALAGWSSWQAVSSAHKIAMASARDILNRDMVYRRWASGHGGVYVPVTQSMQPNPYLINLPERDITTTLGKKLTLVNPSYMNRQVNELGEKQYKHWGHITSLRPIRPGNAPDEWETKALLAFERGEKEVSSIEPPDTKIFFRLMRPLITEPSCLKCHAVHGYKAGDIRGGIGISIPWSPFLNELRANRHTTIFTYSVIWAVGLFGLWVGWIQISSSQNKRKKMEDKIQIISISDQLTGLNNRRGFLSLAEQQFKLSERNKSGMLLFFADLDGLKSINDTHGHEEGDRILLETANVLKETFRASDIIARLGGDEFVVLAIDIKKENSEVFTARLQQLISIWNNKEGRRYKLSISMGCSYFDPANPCSIDKLIASADKLMYEQKQKNHVEK